MREVRSDIVIVGIDAASLARSTSGRGRAAITRLVEQLSGAPHSVFSISISVRRRMRWTTPCSKRPCEAARLPDRAAGIFPARERRDGTHCSAGRSRFARAPRTRRSTASRCDGRARAVAQFMDDRRRARAEHHRPAPVLTDDQDVPIDFSISPSHSPSSRMSTCWMAACRARYLREDRIRRRDRGRARRHGVRAALSVIPGVVVQALAAET